jgi:ribonuclease HI
MAKKKKYYVVWNGHQPGVYEAWPDCQMQVQNFPAAKYKSFSSYQEAHSAYQDSFGKHIGTSTRSSGSKSPTPKRTLDELKALGVDMTAICVDAACSGNPGVLEYQGVTMTGEMLFHKGPFPEGTVNIGEFLAIVSALAMLNAKGDQKRRIYSDSRTGMAWARKKATKTALVRTASNSPLLDSMEKAVQWLKDNPCSNPITKWETEKWGEIPADFGRK